MSQDEVYDPLILSENSGTQFYISHSDPSILEDLTIIDGGVSKLKKHLLGFTNTMTPGHEKPKIKTSFREHNKSDDISIDIIRENEFFTPKDFENSDHRFEGEFDKYGQFHGTITIYGKNPKEYHLPWKGNSGIETLCGSFKLNFSAIQGNLSDSSLPATMHKYMYEKTGLVGGLYIYKNGIRVLPYGDNDFDFLDIEKARSKNARTAHFSYRAIFGAIEIDNVKNAALQEKAGREGFQENKAYRQFRDMLKHFLKKVVEDFILEKGIYSDTYIEEKQILQNNEEKRKKREKGKLDKLKNFLSNFKDALSLLQEFKHIQEMNTLKNELQHQIDKILVFDDTEVIASKIIELENSYYIKLNTIEKAYNVTRPQGIVIKNKTDSELWIVYQAELNYAEENIFEPTKQEIEFMISSAIQNARLEIDRRRRIEKSLTSYIDETKKASNKEKNIVIKKNEDVEESVKKVTKESMKRLEEVIRIVSEEFNTTDFSGMSESEIAQRRMQYECRIDEVAKQERKTLETVQTLLEGVSWEFDEDGNIISDLDIYESHENALNQAQGQMKIDMQLAQIGTAVNIINHEFDSSIRTVRRSLSRFKAWADVNENLAEIYNEVRASFEHIDGYLTLFAPLNRRLYRQKVSIEGREIYKFIENLFRVRLERHNVELVVTEAFKKHTEVGYPSTFYPTFVNLVDNAIYWLKSLQDQKLIIKLDVRNGCFIIEDNGPGIHDDIKNMIFTLGFSSKIGGRGMGLYIAKNSLNELGYDLNLLDVQKGTAFEIIKFGEDNE
jgi:signal transduction histidine kinase